MKHKYLIDMTNKDNWMYPTNGYSADGSISEEQRTINLPEGIDRMYAFTDSVMYPSPPPDGKSVFMHSHKDGYETFFVESGGMDLYIDNQKAYVGPGSIVHLQPYEPHGMTFHKHTIYRGMFHDWNCIDDSVATNLLESYYPDAKKDAEFFSLLLSNIDMVMHEPAVYNEVPVEQMRPVRHPDRPLTQFSLEGVTMKMLTARWENGGKKELWRFEMKKGFRVEWEGHPAMQDMFYVQSGRIKFKVYDSEFEAAKDCLVKIPKYAPHSFEVLEDADMYDVGGQAHWFLFLSDWFSLRKYAPERAADPEEMKKLKKKYGVTWGL
jgi:quercetin dioxygenase-like cupin family protein